MLFLLKPDNNPLNVDTTVVHEEPPSIDLSKCPLFTDHPVILSIKMVFTFLGVIDFQDMPPSFDRFAP